MQLFWSLEMSEFPHLALQFLALALVRLLLVLA